VKLYIRPHSAEDCLLHSAAPCDRLAVLHVGSNPDSSLPTLQSNGSAYCLGRLAHKIRYVHSESLRHPVPVGVSSTEIAHQMKKKIIHCYLLKIVAGNTASE